MSLAGYDDWLEQPYQDAVAEADSFLEFCEREDLDPDTPEAESACVHILPVKAREEALSLFAEDGKISEDDLAKLDRVLDFVSDYFCHCYSVVGDGEQGP